MDFFGFHPLYVVLLLALALIIFGPSRLPKMGAQMGRMLREFQAAREGLTQQMRDAFEEEEEPETDFAASTTAEEDEVEPASEGSAVAVLDPPPAGQDTPEALGTAPTTESEAASEQLSLGDAAAAGVTAALSTPVEPDEAEEPETAALDTPVPATEPEPAGAAGTPAEEAAATEPETAAPLAAEPAAGETGDAPEQPHWDGTRWQYTAEEPSPQATEEKASGEPAPAGDAGDRLGGAGAVQADAPPSGPERAEAAAATHHDSTTRPHDQESRAD